MRLKEVRYPNSRRLRTGIITLDDLRKKFKLPAHAQITVRVPGGADWSGMDVLIGEDIPHINVKVEDIV